jgi:murein DD-endopeptidase MepM/ murein hydrolase activator NlpD
MVRRFVVLCALVAFLLPASLQAGYIGWPCSGSITSDFGPREQPCSGCSTYHYGVDIGVGSGTDLGSPGNGSLSGWVWDSCGGTS